MDNSQNNKSQESELQENYSKESKSQESKLVENESKESKSEESKSEDSESENEVDNEVEMDESEIMDDDWGDWDTSDKSLEVIENNNHNGTLEVITEEKEKVMDKNKHESNDLRKEFLRSVKIRRMPSETDHLEDSDDTDEADEDAEDDGEDYSYEDNGNSEYNYYEPNYDPILHRDFEEDYYNDE